jgi:hypothetical protein
MEIEEIVKILIVVVVLVLMVGVIYVLFTGKGGQVLDAVKNMMRMGGVKK